MQIFSLGLGPGTIGIAPLPGASGDYPGDLQRLCAWRPSLVLSLTTSEELARANAATLGADLAARDIRWEHAPIPDFGAPDPAANTRWSEILARARASLTDGQRVLVHCRGGCGRSGMVALRLMVEAGEPADAALKRLRATRPCAVETAAQLAWATGA